MYLARVSGVYMWIVKHPLYAILIARYVES